MCTVIKVPKARADRFKLLWLMHFIILIEWRRDFSIQMQYDIKSIIDIHFMPIKRTYLVRTSFDCHSECLSKLINRAAISWNRKEEKNKWKLEFLYHKWFYVRWKFLNNDHVFNSDVWNFWKFGIYHQYRKRREKYGEEETGKWRNQRLNISEFVCVDK